MLRLNDVSRNVAFILTLFAIFAGALVISVGSASAQVVPSCSISSAPSSLSASGNITLSWSSTNATSASMNYGIGSVGTNGTWYIPVLSETRTYILTVTGIGGTNTCSVTVPVGNTSSTNPTCSISSSQDNITAGQSVLLSWNSSNATSANLSNIGGVATSGSQTVYPNSTTTYSLTVSGTGGSAVCTRTIIVGGIIGTNDNLPTCTLSAQPQYVFPNGTAVLTYNVQNATTAYIDNGIGSVYNGQGTKVTGTIVGTRTYTLTVTNSYGTRSCTATVNMASSGYTQPSYYNPPHYTQPTYPQYNQPTTYYPQYTQPATYYPQYTQPVYTTPAKQVIKYVQPTYNKPTYTYYQTARPTTYASKRVALSYIPYTGPSDFMYVGVMSLITIVAGAILFRNRKIVLGNR